MLQVVEVDLKKNCYEAKLLYDLVESLAE